MGAYARAAAKGRNFVFSFAWATLLCSGVFFAELLRLTLLPAISMNSRQNGRSVDGSFTEYNFKYRKGKVGHCASRRPVLNPAPAERLSLFLGSYL